MFGKLLGRPGGGPLLGGLLCLALTAPAAHAGDVRPAASPEELVQKLEKAVKAGSEQDIAALLANTPENRGREELLAFFAEHRAAGVLEYTLEERFGTGETVERKSLTDVRIEVVSKEVICEVPVLQLRASWRQEDGSTITRDLPAYVDFEGRGLVLPDGFFGLSAEDSPVVTDLHRYTANLYEKTTRELSEGKYQSREEVIQALRDDLERAEPMQRFMAQVVAPVLARAVAKAFDEAFKEALKKAAQP